MPSSDAQFRFGDTTAHEANKKLPDYQGVLEERLKGLEPSTFCMAKAKNGVGSRRNQEIPRIYGV